MLDDFICNDDSIPLLFIRVHPLLSISDRISRLPLIGAQKITLQIQFIQHLVITLWLLRKEGIACPPALPLLAAD